MRYREILIKRFRKSGVSKVAKEKEPHFCSSYWFNFLHPHPEDL